MPFTDEHLWKCETDPVMCRRYFWSCAMNARRMAVKLRADAKRSPFSEGRQIVKMADTLERFSSSVLENMDRLVKVTVKEEKDEAR